jgi:8-oxo-dGTP pyrophosphatase MutT (NUDIX family)
MPEPEASRIAFAGRYLSVAVETWPGIGEWEVLHKFSAVAIVPITSSGDVVLVRQFRVPIRQDLLEIPAGLLDVEGEDALSCAERELLEETGFDARDTSFLGGLFMSPGTTDEYLHVFVTSVDDAATGPSEDGIEVVRRPFAEMVAAARAGRVRDAMTVLALLLAAERRLSP